MNGWWQPDQPDPGVGVDAGMVRRIDEWDRLGLTSPGDDDAKPEWETETGEPEVEASPSLVEEAVLPEPRCDGCDRV